MDFYLSDLLGSAVVNKEKEKIGTLGDLLITDMAKIHPRIQGMVIDRGRRKDRVFIPEHDIAAITPKLIGLSTTVVNLAPFTARNDEILLAKDIYDKQIVDIDDRRLTRVNDLLLELDKGIVRLKGVDVSMVGILNRLKLPYTDKLVKRNIVDWEDVQFLGGQTPMRFNVQYKNLESLHPVDIARIIFEGPGYKQGSRVLAALKDPIAADIIEELSPKLQKNLIESMKLEDVADVIEHMPAHKAADLLVTLGPQFTAKVLPLIEVQHVKEIETLMNYPENTTGAFMTIDYLAAPAGIVVDQVYEYMRNLEELPDFMLYIYILENERSNRLVGVISVPDLVIADRRDRVEALMMKRVMYVHPHEPIKDALKKMYRYNISALPVVSRPDHKLLGIVTFRDAVSVYLPKRWKLRFRKVFSNGTVS